MAKGIGRNGELFRVLCDPAHLIRSARAECQAEDLEVVVERDQIARSVAPVPTTRRTCSVSGNALRMGAATDSEMFSSRSRRMSHAAGSMCSRFSCSAANARHSSTSSWVNCGNLRASSGSVFPWGPADPHSPINARRTSPGIAAGLRVARSTNAQRLDARTRIVL